MKLRCKRNSSCRLILIIFILFFIVTCGGGDENSSLILTDDDGHHKHDNDGVSSDNIIAVHNPRSSQFDDEKCLNCHEDIPNAQNLDSTIPNAHVAMLPFTPGEKGTQCVWCHTDVSENLIQANAARGPFQTNIRKTVNTQLCAICHGPVGPGKQFYQTGLTTSGDPDGAQLYHYLCAACHKELSNSEVKGESTQEIYAAIAEDEGGMGPLSVLSPQWIQAITVALGGDPTLPPDMPQAGTGAALYQQYCSNCHGTLANSTKAGATAAAIQGAITADTGSMGSLGFLTAPQIQSIAEALGGGTGGNPGPGPGGGMGGTDGASLYQNNCSSCHGDLANSNQAGASATLIQTAILSDTGGMGSLSFLTAQQVQAIADALSGGGAGGGTGGGGTGGTDGASLYQSNCSNCHGSLANSNQAGASATLIQNAIDSDTGGMGVLSSLTAQEIQAIADALSGGGTGGGGTGGGGTGGTDGASLYQSNCSNCHGSLANSNQAGASATLIQNAINNDTGGMGVLSSLTAQEIQAIADALISGGGGGGGDTGGGLPPTHTNSEEGVLHADGNNTPYSSGCTACHGSTLQGSVGPSCFACHGVKWNENPPSGGGDGDDDD